MPCPSSTPSVCPAAHSSPWLAAPGCFSTRTRSTTVASLTLPTCSTRRSCLSPKSSPKATFGVPTRGPFVRCGWSWEGPPSSGNRPSPPGHDRYGGVRSRAAPRSRRERAAIPGGGATGRQGKYRRQSDDTSLFYHSPNPCVSSLSRGRALPSSDGIIAALGVCRFCDSYASTWHVRQ
jgi:hypothetical protein